MDTIKKIIYEFDSLKNKPDIYVIANAQEYTKKNSEFDILHASDDEFFSAEELGEIVSSLFNIGCYVSIFYTELEFIKFILNNDSRINRKNLLVINLSRDGILEGKKSLIPSFCSMMNIKYSGSDPFVVSLCRNKFIWSSVLKNHNISVPDFFEIKENYKVGDINYVNGDKIIIKDIYESASIGFTNESVKLFTSIDDNFIKQNNNKIIQRCIDGIELEVPFFKFKNKYLILDPVQIVFEDDRQYLTTETSISYKYDFSFLKSHDLSQKIKNNTEKIARMLNINGYGRIDYRVNEKNEYYTIDIATMPYIIKHSSFAYWFNEKSYAYIDLYKVLIMSIIYKY